MIVSAEWARLSDGLVSRGLTTCLRSMLMVALWRMALKMHMLGCEQGSSGFACACVPCLRTKTSWLLYCRLALHATLVEPRDHAARLCAGVSGDVGNSDQPWLECVLHQPAGARR